jgi:hypothetical protein
VLIAGDDDGATRKVAGLAEAGGLRPLDVGPLPRARELERLGGQVQRPLMPSVRLLRRRLARELVADAVTSLGEAECFVEDECGKRRGQHAERRKGGYFDRNGNGGEK